MSKLSFLQLSSLFALCASLLFSGAAQADRSYVGSGMRHAEPYYEHPGKGYRMPPGQYKKHQQREYRHEHRHDYRQPYYPAYPRAHYQPRYVQPVPVQPGIHIILPFDDGHHSYQERPRNYVAPRR